MEWPRRQWRDTAYNRQQQTLCLPSLILTDFLSRLFRRGTTRSASARRLEQWLQRGYRSQRDGEHARARQMYQQVLQFAPDNVDAHYLLGSLLGKSGELDQASDHLQRAIAGKPDFADAHAALGNVRLLKNDTQAALSSYERAVQLNPDNAAARSNLGLLAQSCGRHDVALRHFLHAYRLAPGLQDLLKNLTLAYIELEQYDAALALLDRILHEQPGHVDASKFKGFVLQKMYRPEQALKYYQQARAQENPDAELLNNLGVVLQDLGQLDQAIACYDSAIELKPDFELALWHRSLAYLLRHDFARGWTDYDLRLLSIDQPRRPAAYPRWDGSDLSARRILIHAEQGLGDEIMFASCLPQMIAASRHCVIECSPKLEGLFRRSFPAATVYAVTPARDFPPLVRDAGVELQIAMGSLPRFLRRDAADFPRHNGYLRADPERIGLWRERLAALGPGPKIGIAWQGGTRKSRRPLRSLQLAQLLPILRTPGARFVSLQYTDSSTEIAEFEAATGIEIVNWQEVRDDYEHTAALVAALDLVISVCTAVIHLGGALGRPVWVLAPFSPEWRYGIAGETMPWYPSVRAFRQPRYGAWEQVIETVARKLPELINESPHYATPSPDQEK